MEDAKERVLPIVEAMTHIWLSGYADTPTSTRPGATVSLLDSQAAIFTRILVVLTLNTGQLEMERLAPTLRQPLHA